MPKVIKTTVYNFDELPKDIQQKVLERECYINVEHFDWWDSVYEDAKNIGLQINGFDLERNRHCKGEFLYSANEVAQNILNEHGENCETFKTATKFMEVWQPVFNDYMDESSENYESKDWEEKLQKLEDDFLNELLEDYAIMLQNDLEYRTSKEAIKETIEASEYTFTIEGKMMNG